MLFLTKMVQTMPSRFKEEKKRKPIGILKDKKAKKASHRKVKRVQFKELNAENAFRLVMVRAQLQAMNCVSTEAEREQERVQRLLWRRERALARAKAQTQAPSTEGILTVAYNGIKRLFRWS